MPSRVHSNLLLVGSVPGDTTEEALRTCGELFGDSVFALPDGETGERAIWTIYDAFELLRPNPSVEVVQEQIDLPGATAHVPASIWKGIKLRFAPGVEAAVYDRLPRVDAAIQSYQVFKSLREKGVIPSGVRFQLCLPFPASCSCFFWDEASVAHDYPIHERAYEEAVSRELGRLLQAIPASDLAIQWDVCFEVLDLAGLYPWMSVDDAWARFAGPVSRIARGIPDDVLLGYHLCYGTAGGWPMREPDDLSLCVRMANTCVETSGRTVDWLHIAGPTPWRSRDQAFFRPLQQLRPGGARVFLGLIHPSDGVEGLQHRVATASRYLDDFGVAMYCGFGRQPGKSALETLHNHRAVFDTFAEAQALSGGAA